MYHSRKNLPSTPLMFVFYGTVTPQPQETLSLQAKDDAY